MGNMLNIPSHTNAMMLKDRKPPLVIVKEMMTSKSNTTQRFNPKCHFSKAFFPFDFTKIQASTAMFTFNKDIQAERITPP